MERREDATPAAGYLRHVVKIQNEEVLISTPFIADVRGIICLWKWWILLSKDVGGKCAISLSTGVLFCLWVSMSNNAWNIKTSS